jgi:hypothetical protein
MPLPPQHAIDDAPAPRAARLAFGLTLGWFSFAFAELSCGSTPSLFYPAFEFSWSLAITWPLYMSGAVCIPCGNAGRFARWFVCNICARTKHKVIKNSA